MIKMRIICLLMVFLIFQEYAFAYQIGNTDIKFLASISEVYDDNITYLNENTKSDFSTVTSVGINAKNDSKLSSMALTGNIRHQSFAKNNNFDNTSQDFALIFSRELSKFDHFSLRYTFLHAEEQRSFEDQFGNTQGRYSYNRNKFSLGYIHDISKQLSLNLKFYNNIDDNSRSSGVGDSYMNKIETGLDYALSSDLIVKSSYYYSKRTFKSGPSASSNVFSAGLRRYLTSQLSVEALGGVDFINAYDGTKYTKPLFMASLNDEIDQNSYLRLSLAKQYSTVSYSQNIFDQWQIALDFVHQIFKRLALSLSAFYGKGEYTSTNTKNNLRGGNIGLAYDIKENIKVDISYGHLENTSNISANGYNKNTVSLAMRAEF